MVAAAVCSPRGCVRQRRLAEVVAGSRGDAVAQARAKARLGHGGGLTEICGIPDDGASIPASDKSHDHVRHDLQSLGSS